MSKAKAVLVARVKSSNGQFPFVAVEVRRNAIKLPIEANGKVYELDAILGYFARYPHVVGNCLFPGCTGGVQRHVESLGKDHTEAYAKYQRIERDFSRVREGKLPVEPVKVVKGLSLVEVVANFEQESKAKQRKPRTVESYMKSLEQFSKICAEAGVNTVVQVEKGASLRVVR